MQKTCERSVINYYQEIFYNKILLKKPFVEYMIRRVCGRLNKQKVQHDRRAVADVTVYYLCVHMCDKEFMATMVPSYFPAVFPSFPWHRGPLNSILFADAFPMCSAFPGCSKLLTNSRGASERMAIRTITEDRSSDSQIRLYSGSFASPINSHHLPSDVSAIPTDNYLTVWLPSLTISDFLHGRMAINNHDSDNTDNVSETDTSCPRRMDIGVEGSFIGRLEILICPEG